LVHTDLKKKVSPSETIFWLVRTSVKSYSFFNSTIFSAELPLRRRRTWVVSGLGSCAGPGTLTGCCFCKKYIKDIIIINTRGSATFPLADQEGWKEGALRRLIGMLQQARTHRCEGARAGSGSIGWGVCLLLQYLL